MRRFGPTFAISARSTRGQSTRKGKERRSINKTCSRLGALATHQRPASVQQNNISRRIACFLQVSYMGRLHISTPQDTIHSGFSANAHRGCNTAAEDSSEACFMQSLRSRGQACRGPFVLLPSRPVLPICWVDKTRAPVSHGRKAKILTATDRLFWARWVRLCGEAALSL